MSRDPYMTVGLGQWILSVSTDKRLDRAARGARPGEHGEDEVIGLLQRVSEASVTVDGDCVAAVGEGLLVLIGVEVGDEAAGAHRLAERIAGYRVFADDAGRMNRSVQAVAGEVLAVPQFTLAAATAKGSRPGFSTAAAPDGAADLFGRMTAALESFGVTVRTGVFGADMQVASVNQGPVTFHLRVPPPV